MSKILVPVPVSKRLPEIKDAGLSGTVIVRYVNEKVSKEFSGMAFAYRDESGRWEESDKPDKPILFEPQGSNKVIEWFEEKELESLFPDEDKAHNVAESASQGWLANKTCHLEGQIFFKNYILRELKK
jgi:hypothetical protein